MDVVEPALELSGRTRRKSRGTAVAGKRRKAEGPQALCQFLFLHGLSSSCETVSELST